MNRLALLVTTAALALAACADNPTVIIIRNNQPTGACSVDTSITGSNFLGFGILDVSQFAQGENPGYWFTPVVQNSAAGKSGNQNIGWAFIQGADVTLLASNTPRSIEVVGKLSSMGQAQRTARFSASVKGDGGLASLGFPAIDAGQTTLLAQQLADQESIQVIAHVDVFGTINGNDFTSPKFDYPITVCHGCIAKPVACPEPTGTAVSTGGACNILQDPQTGAVATATTVDCCGTADKLTCPATVSP